ncbi:starvation-inducible DNA-binding protein [Lishizhenia tianjinensis]|uniref:Starvation-inducible DNA-binding protein n=1 Tax=Lishizhenia tianjinensis TaxID=477690 RepID=A0A1I6XRF1_9FLAO|nr:DNA starvation/stationary phase protection protein [Lishizhenia tianjinensis]SFT40703.1 starvation-inducible DNA-binding protein [Lishizhenia tianjinensis]
MKKSKKLVKLLNTLLATYQIHYQNLRALHWNIRGNDFFEIHAKYEELYLRTQTIIDDLAERILTLEAQPLHSYQAYLDKSVIAENEHISEARVGMSYVVKAQEELLVLEREILAVSGELEDEGTNSLASDLIGEKEKTNWMFKAWINK